MLTAILTHGVELAVVFLLGAAVRELRMIRERLGGHVSFWPWEED